MKFIAEIVWNPAMVIVMMTMRKDQRMLRQRKKEEANVNPNPKLKPLNMRIPATAGVRHGNVAKAI